MENSKSAEEDDPFFDAPDDFPFYDCSTILDSVVSDSHSTSPPKSKFVESTPNSSTPSSAGLRQRRRLLSQRTRRDSFSNASEGLNCSSSGQSELSYLVNEDASSSGFGERKRKYSRDLKDCKAYGAKLESDKGALKLEGLGESRTEGKSESSTITSLINDRIDNEGATDSSTVREHDENHYKFLVSIAGLVIKAIGFQFSVFISFISFPLWALYFSFMFVINPFQTMKRGKDYMAEKFTRIYDVVMQVASPFLSEWMKENKSVLSMVVRFGWALFWSMYVCSVLFTLLVSAFIISGLMMRRFVEEPFQLKQPLNFDYTKDRPVAFVPITACPGINYVDSVGITEVGNAGRERVISPGHKLLATVELLLPESDYNRNLGVFQVRVEFLSATNGKTLASLSHPCMLQFKSEPIRLLLTFFKILPLVAGYISESQSMHLKFKGFTEGNVPTECVKVVMEQRAEFRRGAGIPEVYDAYILLESELPFLKRVLWCWRKTIFVWTGTMLFMMELMFTIVCCRPLIMPRIRGHGGGGGDRNHGARRANNQS